MILFPSLRKAAIPAFFPSTALSIFSRISAAVVISVICGAHLAHAATIKVGLPGPITGPVTQYGDMVRAGAMTAVEQINAGGGPNQFELVPVDDVCEPKQAVLAANKLVSQGVKFVIGHLCSGATIAAADIYENEGTVMISPSATAPQLTEAKYRKFIFRTIGRDDQQAPAAANYIVQKLKPKRVAILHDKQSYGQGLANSVKATLDAAQVPLAIFEGINAGESDYSAVITKLKAQGVDVVYYGGYFPELGLLLRQAREQGLKAVFVGPEGAGNKNLNAIAGPAAEGLLITQPADFSADPANAAIKQAFLNKKRDPVGGFQMPAYAAMQVLEQALAATGGSDTDKVAAYIHSHPFKTAIGNIEFTPIGDLRAFKFDIYTWHKDGNSTLAGQAGK